MTSSHPDIAADKVAKSPTWTCFHCAESFTESTAAAEHFGSSEYQLPACQIPIAEYRAMEKRMHAYNEEDAAIHRQMRDVEFSKAEAVRDAEQRGYDRGLRDAQRYQGDATSDDQCDRVIRALGQWTTEGNPEQQSEWRCGIRAALNTPISALDAPKDHS